MNRNKSKFTDKVINETSKLIGTLKTFNQPFKEFSAALNVSGGNEERINAHELFSLYTANVIKEENVFVR